LTIVGLNALVMLAWTIVQDIVGPAGPLSTGSPARPARPWADWPESLSMWLDWLTMLAISGALLAVAAWRIWGPIGTSPPPVDALEDASSADEGEIGSQPAETGQGHDGSDTRPSHPRIGATFVALL
jgi:hypothetical protein